MAHVFCRDLCLERGEPLEGTGDAPERALLLSWPRGHWRSPRWQAEGMSPALAAAMHEVAHKELHVALVDKVGGGRALPMLQAVPEGVAADFATEAELIAAIRDYADGVMFAGTHDPRIVVMVCTDSRRDACCARYGFSTYKALDAIADKDRFHIVQATHLGGCRFAASIIVMPQGQRYGRMTAGQAPAFLEALARDEIFLPAFRGRRGAPEAEQAAEIAALRWAEAHGRPAAGVVLSSPGFPDEPTQGALLSIAATVSGHALSITLVGETFTIQGNCDAVAGDELETAARWRVTTVAEVTRGQ